MHPGGENNLKFNNFHIVEFFMNSRVVHHFPNNIIINSLHCIFIERARVSKEWGGGEDMFILECTCRSHRKA